MLTGKDEFMQTAADRGPLVRGVQHEDRRDAGLPRRAAPRRRGGGHQTDGGVLPAKKVGVSWPTYGEVMEKGVGAFLHDPAKAPRERVFAH